MPVRVVASPCVSDHAHFSGAVIAKDAGAFVRGRAGGDDAIDKYDGTAQEFGSVIGEDAADVEDAVPSAFANVGLRLPDARELPFARNLIGVTQDQFRLVEAALAEA